MSPAASAASLGAKSGTPSFSPAAQIRATSRPWSPLPPPTATAAFRQPTHTPVCRSKVSRRRPIGTGMSGPGSTRSAAAHWGGGGARSPGRSRAGDSRRSRRRSGPPPPGRWVPATRRSEQRDGRFDGKAEDAQSRHPGQLGPEMVCVAGREDHCGCLCLKPAGHERQGVQRFGSSRCASSTTHTTGRSSPAAASRPSTPSRPGTDPVAPLGRTGRNPQRAPLPRWKRSQVGPERHQEPLQRRVGDGRLRLIAVSTQHIEPDQLGCGGGQQRRLSNAGLPRQQQSPTCPFRACARSISTCSSS